MAAAFPPLLERAVTGGYPSLCLSSQGFDAFVELLGGRDTLKGKTTTEVKKILKAFSPCFEGPVVQHPTLLPYTGEATVFVSHCYEGAFLDVVDCLKAWESSSEAGTQKDSGAAEEAALSPPHRHYFYFDLLVENQFFGVAESQGSQPSLDFDFLSSRFGDKIKCVPQTLLVMNWIGPQVDGSVPVPMVLTRAWCVFEIAMSHGEGKMFDVLLPHRDCRLFIQHMEAEPTRLKDLLCAVSVEDCSAYNPRDKAGILDFIARGKDIGGCEGVNRVVNEALRAFVRKEGRRHLEGLPPGERFHSPFARSYLALLSAHGAYHDPDTEGYIRVLAGALYWTIALRYPRGVVNDDTLYAQFLRLRYGRYGDIEAEVALYYAFRQHLTLGDTRTLETLSSCVGQVMNFDPRRALNMLSDLRGEGGDVAVGGGGAGGGGGGGEASPLPTTPPSSFRSSARAQLRRQGLESVYNLHRPPSPPPSSTSLPILLPPLWVEPPVPTSLEDLIPPTLPSLLEEGGGGGSDSSSSSSSRSSRPALEEAAQGFETLLKDPEWAPDHKRKEVLRCLGLVQAALGRLEEAEATLRESLALARHLHPHMHVEVFHELVSLCGVLVWQAQAAGGQGEKFREVVGLLEDTVVFHWRDFSERSRKPQYTHRGLRCYGYALLGVGDGEGGRQWLARAHAMRKGFILHAASKRAKIAEEEQSGERVNGWLFWPYSKGDIPEAYHVIRQNERRFVELGGRSQVGSGNAGGGVGGGGGRNRGYASTSPVSPGSNTSGGSRGGRWSPGFPSFSPGNFFPRGGDSWRQSPPSGGGDGRRAQGMGWGEGGGAGGGGSGLSRGEGRHEEHHRHSGYGGRGGGSREQHGHGHGENHREHFEGRRHGDEEWIPVGDATHDTRRHHHHHHHHQHHSGEVQRGRGGRGGGGDSRNGGPHLHHSQDQGRHHQGRGGFRREGGEVISNVPSGGVSLDVSSQHPQHPHYRRTGGGHREGDNCGNGGGGGEGRGRGGGRGRRGGGYLDRGGEGRGGSSREKSYGGREGVE